MFLGKQWPLTIISVTSEQLQKSSLIGAGGCPSADGASNRRAARSPRSDTVQVTSSIDDL